MPVKAGERAGSLDALRGFALLGICLANSGYFSMYIFKGPEQLAAMPFPELDKMLTFLHYALIVPQGETGFQSFTGGWSFCW